jgi:hypothetical protein
MSTFASPFRFLTGEDSRGGYVAVENESTRTSRKVHRASLFDCRAVVAFLENAPASIKRTFSTMPEVA